MKESQNEQVNHAVFRILELVHGKKDLNSMFETIHGIISELMHNQGDADLIEKKDLLKLWAEVDHSLRSPMCGILGFSEILMEELVDEEARWKTEQIVFSAKKMKSVLDNTIQRFAFEAGEVIPEDSIPDPSPVMSVKKESGGRIRPKSAGKKLPNVLIVEDNMVNINLLMIYIRRYCNIFSTKTALSAIEMTHREKFDAILMDINLGQGMDGTQAMHEIRKQPGYEKIPIIAVTAYAAMGDREKFLLEGFNEYISKPIKREEIKSVMEKLFKTVL
jgi:CheY-like chemotaxis protein